MIKILTILMASTLSVAVYAQKNDEKTLTAAVETFRQAMIDGNKAILENIAAEDLSYGHSSGVMEDKTAFVTALTSGKSDFVAIELSEQSVKIVNGVGLVRHKLIGEINDGGRANTVRLGVLLVWQKQKGEWKLLARQAFKL